MGNDKNKVESTSIVLVPIAGLVLLAGCFILYYGIYMFIESTFYSQNMGGMPAEAIRLSLAAFLILLYLVVLRTKLSELWKAILMIPPLAMLLIAFTLGVYQSVPLMVTGLVAIPGLCALWLYKSKKSWVFYYAEAITVAAAIFYAWPRS